MKLHYFICLLFVFCSCRSLALSLEKDTIAKEKYQLTKKEFLAEYGKDDSSIALINFYFENRNLKKGHSYFYLGVSAIEALLIVNVIGYKGEHPIEDTGTGFGLAAFSVIVFIPLTTYSLIKLNQAEKKFPKRQLYLDLLSYQAGRGLPEKYRQQIIENPSYWKAP